MEVPRHWRLKPQRLRLEGEVCPHCEEKIFPPRDICPNQNCGINTFDIKLDNGVIYKAGAIKIQALTH